jgi:hypothetical protein
VPNFAREVPFPDGICPTSRKYAPGVIPKTTFEAQNGASSWVYYGRQHVNARLELGFRNINDDQAAEIINHYESLVEDDFVSFRGSQNAGLAGTSQNLRNAMQDGLDVVRWHYDGPPEITSVYPGVSSVQVKFIGYLYGV